MDFRNPEKDGDAFSSRRLVLWLRKFHQTDLMEFPFPAFLERVCRGVAVPITLQDSTVASARTAAALLPSYYALVGLQMSCWFALFISLAIWSDQETGWNSEKILPGGLSLLALGGLVGSGLLLPRLGVVRLGTRRGQKLVKTLVASIESEAGVPQTLTIVSTPDETWQEWVLYFMRKADAILIDVTHLSEKLHWELHQLTGNLNPEQVIFAYGTQEGSKREIPSDLVAELEHVIGKPMVEQSQRFFYDLPQPSRWNKLLRRFRTKQSWLQPTRAQRKRYERGLIDALSKSFSIKQDDSDGQFACTSRK